jgi:hypothetical protein
MALGVIVKHLRWYISTSEVIPRAQQVELVDALENVYRKVQIAQRKEQQLAPDISERRAAWIGDVNAIRNKHGKRPVGERRLVDELISSILEL